jgi:hypothetical protein
VSVENWALFILKKDNMRPRSGCLFGQALFYEGWKRGTQKSVITGASLRMGTDAEPSLTPHRPGSADTGWTHTVIFGQ